ncbi:MarR family winged helix-turn-helix transcriptional regulator [uncultured Dysosmobacter sp.]|uniref:MarR family winged helix-turn-helix transcriptional regulator n=1 Tax=uncultured Dysosmobacter sp. TaxID=2591384 RepID=UPI002634115E|nr:MarR family transcriptional regulator [uncultured Dysosmobacter sp.]
MKNRTALGALVKRIYDSFEKQANSLLRTQDLTMAQFGVLVELSLTAEKQLTLKELEQRLHVAQSTTAGIVVRLEQKKLVECFGDPVDRRIKLVRITAAGEKRLQYADQDMEATERSMLSALSAQEQDTLLRLLEKLCSSLP